MLHPLSPNNQTADSGFTIIELLIATVIFSAIMLLLSIGVIQIANVYYKGITESNTQNVARDIINNIAQAIEFNSTGPILPPSTNGFGPPGTTSLCIGNTQYAYVLGYQLVKSVPAPASHQTNHGMLENNSSCASGNSLDLNGSLPAGDANDAELLGQNMRLANLTITQLGSSNFYTIDVRVVYGADDLLTNPTSTTTNCQGGAGSQFCAVAELSTTVQQRL